MPISQTFKLRKLFADVKYFFIGLILFLSFSVQSSAQDPTRGIYVRPYYEKQDLGLFFSLGETFTEGTLYAECPGCRFREAGGSQVTVGAEYFYFFNEYFFAGVLGYYNGYTLTGRFWEYETVELDNYPGESADIAFRHRADLETHGIRGGAFGGIRLGKWLYLKAGLSAGIHMTSNFKHTKVIKTRTAVLSDGEVVLIGINPDGGAAMPGSDRDRAIIEDGKPYPEMSIPIFVDFSVGMNVGIRDYFYLFPQLQYSYSLNPISSYGNELFLHNWSIKVELIINRKLIDR